ncbi:hypothetical protein [Vreelandella venusta]|uniref:hypothetical protein n=1 Tax=Vreelandella venusta TaxID=44935 RepID=UPI001170BF49|nr:hypothetical protein [Halomonas venusta]GEK52320.1 hypothetical protein HVE01_30410 [Halomonas venusta]
MSTQTTVTHDQINQLAELFKANKPAVLIAREGCTGRLTAGKHYPVIDLDGRRLVVREDDGDRIRVGGSSDWMSQFYALLTEEEIKAAEAAKALLEARKVTMETKTTDQLIEIVKDHRSDLDMATEILRKRLKNVI